ncbi:hypothetical protein MMC29_000499 [Sticta canariensis]|nr:hypothetical protein [Sticta canariensis]
MAKLHIKLHGMFQAEALLHAIHILTASQKRGLQQQLQGQLLMTTYGVPQLYSFLRLRTDLSPASVMEGAGRTRTRSSMTYGEYLR